MSSFKLKSGTHTVFLPGVGKVLPNQVISGEHLRKFVPQFLEEVVELKKAEPVVDAVVAETVAEVLAEVKVSLPPPAVIYIPPVEAPPPLPSPPPPPPAKPEPTSDSPTVESPVIITPESRPTPPPPPAKEKKKKRG